MKKLSTVFVAIFFVSMTALAGGIQNRKTKSVIRAECTTQKCDSLVFIEVRENSLEKKVISRDISKTDLLLATEAISSGAIDGRPLPTFEMTAETASDVGDWLEEGNPGVLLILPGGAAAIAATFVVEGLVDGVDAGIVAISNSIKTRKLKSIFENQINGDKSKMTRLTNKNYERVKKALSQI